MKPDGVTMETMEPTEAAAGAEPSLSQGAAVQEEVTEQAQPASQPDEGASTTVPPAAQEANGKPAAADSKAKPQAVASKTKPAAKTAGASGPKSRPGAAPNRTVNGVKPSNSVPPRTAAVKKTTTTTGASTAGAVPKRPVGGAVASSTVRTQTKVPDRKPVGSVKATSAAATVTNGTKPTTANSTPKRPAAGPVNVAKPKPTAPASRTATKPSNSTTARPERTAVSKTTRPATSTTSRPASNTSRPATAGAGSTAATTKPSTTGTAKAAASRVAVAPSAGRTTAVQPPKNNAAAKRDVSRPTSATAIKKPTTTTTSAASKKPEPSKSTATLKPDGASKRPVPTKAADPKPPRPKTQEPAKPTPIKKPAPSNARLPALNKPPLGRTPPASPANKPVASSTAQAKRGPKPTQAVQPFTAIKKAGAANSTTAAEGQNAAAIATAATAVVAATTAVAAAVAVVAEETVVPAETQAEAGLASPEAAPLPASAVEEAPSSALAQDTPAEIVLQEAAQGNSASPSPPQSPVRTAIPPACPPQDLVETIAPSLTAQEQVSAPTEAALPPVASPPELSEEYVLLVPDQTPSTSKAPPLAVNASLQVVSSSNLNEEEDEEEREGSQQVSVSEMSGTTQPTEESRPGSAGPLGGSAWRVGGALLSELDSEEVSGSQQGASELSAPGVLEGTESMDDLGDASLKGGIDMEGASAGSPDFEKVPDIPVNDFEEDEDDDDDDEDRVCDMDVGSERADDLQRPRHDNEVDDDDEEDEDVEMASEGVTESGLESYGNADEDDFAEDERLDNLNRVAQPPPPPPLLPSAPAAQWDQPNPFADPWAQPIQLLEPQQPFEHILQPLQAAAASPCTDPWQADSETPTQSPAQAWLELGSAPFVPQNQGASHHSSAQAEPLKPEAQTYMDQSSPVPMQTLAPAPLSAPGMSLSSTLSSETSTPEELCEYNREGKPQLPTQGAQAPVLSLQPDPEDQDLGIHLERGDGEGEEEGEAETLPADEVLGGPETAPTSNPSSSSTTEDEASDTEGEAQLDDPLDGQGINNITFDCQPPNQRCLSAVDEGEEEVEGGVGGDATPPSANSAASYGFDTMTTASNSNAQSTGESCTKSPGIFSLEELPEEAKEPCLIQEPPAQPCPAEQHYMQCGKQEAEMAEDVGVDVSGPQEALDPSLSALQQPEGDSDDPQPPYYSAICEKTENSFAGFSALPHTHRRDHSAYLRPYCDIVKPPGGTVTPARLSCADLPPRSPAQQALSPQLRRLEQHQKQLLELQQRRELQSKPMETVEQERKRREEEEQRKKREEAEEEIKKNKEEEERKREQAEALKKKEEEEELEKQRRDLELQLQQQQQELKQRQQIMQWQQELEQQQQSHKGQSTVLLSPSSGLCTIYEALENSDEEEVEEDEDEMKELKPNKEPREEMLNQEMDHHHIKVTPDEDKHQCSSPPTPSPPPPPPLPDSPQSPADPQHPGVSNPPQDEDSSSPPPPESPERPPPLDLDWGKKVDIVQQLINQTLLLTGDGCSSLLLLPGGRGGGTLSPLESSLWPSLLPPLTPPSATVTSVSSFSPEAPGSSPQGEWTVVELETHH